MHQGARICGKQTGNELSGSRWDLSTRRQRRQPRRRRLVRAAADTTTADTLACWAHESSAASSSASNLPDLSVSKRSNQKSSCFSIKSLRGSGSERVTGRVGCGDGGHAQDPTPCCPSCVSLARHSCSEGFNADVLLEVLAHMRASHRLLSVASRFF